MNDTKIQWHPGFIAAMQLEFAKNREFLEFHPEYNLSTKPLMIDLLIKETSNKKLDNEIGEIFRKYNILEYKSPDDKLNDDTLHKVLAYAHLLVFFGDSAAGQGIDEGDVTITLVRCRKPRKLFQYVKQKGLTTENPHAGIYYIREGFHFPVQIVITKELDENLHDWLQALSRNLKKQDIQRLVQAMNGLSSGFERECADSVLQVSLEANQALMKKLRGDDGMCEALREFFKPELQEAELRGISIGTARERAAWEEKESAWADEKTKLMKKIEELSRK